MSQPAEYCKTGENQHCRRSVCPDRKLCANKNVFFFRGPARQIFWFSCHCPCRSLSQNPNSLTNVLTDTKPIRPKARYPNKKTNAHCSENTRSSSSCSLSDWICEGYAFKRLFWPYTKRQTLTPTWHKILRSEYSSVYFWNNGPYKQFAFQDNRLSDKWTISLMWCFSGYWGFGIMGRWNNGRSLNILALERARLGVSPCFQSLC